MDKYSSIIGVEQPIGATRIMLRNFTLEYWIDDGWYVGRLREVPGVFSQAGSVPDLEENFRDAYRLMPEEEGKAVQGREIHK